jgi:hypothetical protein
MTSYIATKDETVSWSSSYKEEERARRGGSVTQQKILERLLEDFPLYRYALNHAI